MSRVQIPDLNAEQIQPKAGPINRYSTPAAPVQVIGPSKSAQISDALSSLVPELTKFSANREERQNEDQIRAAREMRTKNALTFKDAVNKGTISPDQNPWFVKAWKEMDGSVAADKYSEDLTLALATGPLANSTDHTESSKLLDNFRTNWMKEHVQDQDTDYIAGFRAKAAGYELNARSHQAATVGNNIVNAAGVALSNNIQGIISESYSRGISASAVAEGINREADKALLVGMSPKDVNAMILKAVDSDAIENLDSGHAEAILSQIKAGPGSYLGGTAQAAEHMTAIKNQIASELHQRDTWANEAAEKHKKEIAATAVTSVGTALLESQAKGTPLTLEQMKPQIDAVFATGNWDLGESMKNAIITANKEPKTEAGFVKDNLYVSVLSGHSTDFARLNRALSAGEINIATYKDLGDKINEIVRQNKEDAKVPDFHLDHSYTMAGTIIDKAISKNDTVFSADSVALQLQISAQYWNRMYAYHKGHPNATSDEKETYATETAYKLLKGLPGEFSGAGDSGDLLRNTPGAKSGDIHLIGVSGIPGTTDPHQPLLAAREPHFANPKAWEAALTDLEKYQDTSQIAAIARQYGMTIEQFISIQDPLYPVEKKPSAAPAKKKK